MKKPNRAFSLIELSIVILIIGVLIAAVGQGIDLLQDARLTAARMATQSSRVASLKDLALWLDATSEASFSSAEAVDGASISAWNDINPQRDKNNFVQSTEAQKPTYKERMINNLPAIKFDGTSENMYSTTFPNITSGAMTVFAVVKSAATLYAYQAATPGDAIVSKRVAAGGNINIELVENSGGFLINNFYGITQSLIGNNVYVASYSVSQIASKGFINGVGILNIAGAFYWISSNPAKTDYLFIGKQGLTAAPTYLGGSIGELIIFDRELTKKDRQSVEAYLGKKWGIKMTVASY